MTQSEEVNKSDHALRLRIVTTQSADRVVSLLYSGIGESILQWYWRKIDGRIMPVMFLCYTMQFLDKVILNYAAVMGLNKDLHLRGNDFSNASTALFIAYLIAEVPNGYLVQKLPAAKWLCGNVIAWGIATACIAATTDYTTLIVARVFIGIFESVIAPCLMVISSQYYTRSEQAPRFSFWYCGLGFAQIVGGLISFAFQHVDPGASLNGWRLMFLVMGLVTVLIGVLTGWTVPDTPMRTIRTPSQRKFVRCDFEIQILNDEEGHVYF